jgi:hypothetical protein
MRLCHSFANELPDLLGYWAHGPPEKCGKMLSQADGNAARACRSFASPHARRSRIVCSGEFASAVPFGDEAIRCPALFISNRNSNRNTSEFRNWRNWHKKQQHAIF